MAIINVSVLLGFLIDLDQTRRYQTNCINFDEVTLSVRFNKPQCYHDHGQLCVSRQCKSRFLYSGFLFCLVWFLPAHPPLRLHPPSPPARTTKNMLTALQIFSGTPVWLWAIYSRAWTQAGISSSMEGIFRMFY